MAKLTMTGLIGKEPVSRGQNGLSFTQARHEGAQGEPLVPSVDDVGEIRRDHTDPGF